MNNNNTFCQCKNPKVRYGSKSVTCLICKKPYRRNIDDFQTNKEKIKPNELYRRVDEHLLIYQKLYREVKKEIGRIPINSRLFHKKASEARLLNQLIALKKKGKK